MNTFTITKVPVATDQVIALAVKALAGAQAVGVIVGLEQNPAAKIATDLYALTGDPATPLVPGAQAAYAAQKLAVKDAYAAGRVAVQGGIDYCQLAIGVLKSVLGTRWNTRWNAAGFVAPSLALPRDPVPMLIRFREYFNAHSDREVPSINLTAAHAHLRMTEIQQANVTIGEARNLLMELKAARDASLTKLQQRLMGLRSELDQVLSDEDGRWYEFGFRRPADGRQPGPVAGLTLTPGGAGMVLVKWAAAPKAENYRVGWKPSSGEPTIAAGLVADTQLTLTGLPSGVPVVIGVSARNGSGERAPTEATIVVP